jgi:hypothetical protein
MYKYINDLSPTHSSQIAIFLDQKVGALSRHYYKNIYCCCVSQKFLFYLPKKKKKKKKKKDLEVPCCTLR